MKAIVADRGQVTIPKQIRDRFGIVPSTVLEFYEEEGKLIVTKVVEEDPVSKSFYLDDTGNFVEK